jgi:hypothetical protein
MNQYLNEHALLYISKMRNEKAKPDPIRVARLVRAIRLSQFLGLIIRWAR